MSANPCSSDLWPRKHGLHRQSESWVSLRPHSRHVCALQSRQEAVRPICAHAWQCLGLGALPSWPAVRRVRAVDACEDVVGALVARPLGADDACSLGHCMVASLALDLVTLRWLGRSILACRGNRAWVVVIRIEAAFVRVFTRCSRLAFFTI